MNNLDLCELAVNVCLDEYGKTGYCNTPGDNIMVWHPELGIWKADCLGFVHTMVNGFSGNKSVPGGGAVLDSFVLMSDESTTLYKYCYDISENFADIVPGELLYMDTHVGLWVGDREPFQDGRIFNTCECTPKWGGGCLLSYTDDYGIRYNHKGGASGGRWYKHGKFNRVEYLPEKTEYPVADAVTPYTVLNVVVDILNNVYGCQPEREQKITEKYGYDVFRKAQDIINILYR